MNFFSLHRKTKNLVFQNSKERGFALTIAITLMTLTVSAVLAIAVLFLREFKLNSDLKYSTQAFYAAETGIEYFLWQYRRQGLGNQGSCVCDTYCASVNDTPSCLGNGATYSAVYDFSLSSTTVCTPQPCTVSTGELNGIKRAIKTNF